MYCSKSEGLLWFLNNDGKLEKNQSCHFCMLHSNTTLEPENGNLNADFDI